MEAHNFGLPPSRGGQGVVYVKGDLQKSRIYIYKDRKYIQEPYPYLREKSTYTRRERMSYIHIHVRERSIYIYKYIHIYEKGVYVREGSATRSIVAMWRRAAAALAAISGGSGVVAKRDLHRSRMYICKNRRYLIKFKKTIFVYTYTKIVDVFLSFIYENGTQPVQSPRC